MTQARRQAYLAQISFTRKSKISNGRHYSALNLFGYGDKAAVTGVRANLHRAVVQNHVGKRNTIVLVNPVCIQRNISVKCIGIILYALRAMLVVIPTVKNGIESIRLGQFLQGMPSDKDALHVVHLIGQHVKGNRSALFDKECIGIHRAKAIVPVAAKITKIIRRCVQLLGQSIKSQIGVVLHIQRNQASHCRAR